MSLIRIAAKPASGIAALDELHRLCRAAIDDLVNAGEDRLEAGFHILLRQFEYAFRMEEQWMENVDYAALKPHREQHARVMGALHHVHLKVMDGDFALGRRVLDDLLPHWLSLHVDTMDSALAIALCDGAVGAPAAIRKPCDALSW